MRRDGVENKDLLDRDGEIGGEGGGGWERELRERGGERGGRERLD